MCGIIGFNEKNEAKLKHGLEVIKHRGPDFAGEFYADDLSLGHRLLAIREVSDVSKQPYVLNERFTLIFNGQIYNTDYIKEKFLQDYDKNLENLDTYLLYKLIEIKGYLFPSVAHGMFAIGLYDRQKNELYLYRDPSGQKPVYYYFKDGTFIFCSELKGILASPEVDKTLNVSGLHTAITLGYIPGQQTLYQHIKKLRPGEFIKYSSGNLHTDFYQTDPLPYYEGDFPDVLETLIEEHLQSKVDVSVNLSGGLDSALIAAMAAKSGRNIFSFTTSFQNSDNPKYNEDAVLAKQLAKDLGFQHTEISISKQMYLDNLFEAYATVEEPNYNISLPVYLITAKTEGIHGKGLRVVLSGDGGDEIFGGYPHYLESTYTHSKIKKFTPFGYNLLKNIKYNTRLNYNDPVSRWLTMKRLTHPGTRTGEQKTRSKEIFYEVLKILQSEAKTKYGENLKNLDPVRQMMMLDRLWWLADENFLRSDKLYMSQSMEMRCPFAYEPFRQYIDSSFRWNDKDGGDYFNGKTNKWKLRQYADKILPDYIARRPTKSGWRAPVQVWYDKEVKNKFLEILPAENSNHVLWKSIREQVETTDSYPGKWIHIFLSLAIIKQSQKIDL